MKKYSSGSIVVVVALTLVSFSSNLFGEKRISYYFKFVGISNNEEADVTKWDEVTATAYSFLNCPGVHYGCKLISTSTQTINGVARPTTVYLAAGTNDPIVGATVTEVKNKIN